MFAYQILILLGLLLRTCHSSMARVDIDEFDLYPRPVSAILKVKNGLSWGWWMREEFCPKGTFASAIELKAEATRYASSDDTGLNGVSLRCTHPLSNEYYGLVRSDAGPWGVWDQLLHCGRRNDIQLFITAFQMRVERPRGRIIDDTAVNNVRFHCAATLYRGRSLESRVRAIKGTSDFYKFSDIELTDRLEARGSPFGELGKWSEECPDGSAVCGIQTRLSEPQGDGDDTAMNDLRLFCCTDFPVRKTCN